MKGLHGIIEPAKKGKVEISEFEFDSTVDPMHNVRAMMEDPLGRMANGWYLRLVIDEILIMSDTDMEKRTNVQFCRRANGHVLIAGLGLGLIIQNIRDKYESGKVKSITVVEKSKDLISLVSPYFKDMNIKYHCADVFDFVPEKGQKWDTIYFDIWPEREQENLEGIKILHNRYKFRLNRDNPNCWMDSWYKSQLQYLRAKDMREARMYREMFGDYDKIFVRKSNSLDGFKS